MSFFVTGDTHGNVDFQKLTSRKFTDGEYLTKKDYVLICGDFGIVWDGVMRDQYLKKWYDNKPWTTIVIDGNHDNHSLLNSYPVSNWNGGKVHRISDSVIHLMRGEIYTIDGRKIFVFGGAESYDKQFRTEGRSWWKAELPTMEEIKKANTNLRNNNRKIDYIFTHCASTYIQDRITEHYPTNYLTDYFNEIESFDFGKWYFGHYHIDRDIDGQHTAIYNKVQRLW